MEENKEVNKGERIAKVIARAGVCSRRDAERLIADGKVKVNGKTINSPALNVSDTDKIAVGGKLIPTKEKTRLWKYHKPTGLVTTHKDEKDRQTVFSSLPPDMPRVISVGRLDLNSEGLLLLTNDGELARRLEMPKNAWKRRYRVRVFGEPTKDMIAQLKKGVEIDGVQYGEISVTIDRVKGDNSWLTIALQEGKNREIRKVMEHFGYQVSRLIRVAYGPFQLGSLPEGGLEEVPQKVLKEQLGVL